MDAVVSMPQRRSGWSFIKIIFVVAPRRPGKVPINPMMRQAYNEGAEYLVRVNDDTEFTTRGWISLGVE